jgi:hypothetical protein
LFSYTGILGGNNGEMLQSSADIWTGDTFVFKVPLFFTSLEDFTKPGSKMFPFSTPKLKCLYLHVELP